MSLDQVSHVSSSLRQTIKFMHEGECMTLWIQPVSMMLHKMLLASVMRLQFTETTRETGVCLDAWDTDLS